MHVIQLAIIALEMLFAKCQASFFCVWSACWTFHI